MQGKPKEKSVDWTWLLLSSVSWITDGANMVVFTGLSTWMTHITKLAKSNQSAYSKAQMLIQMQLINFGFMGCHSAHWHPNLRHHLQEDEIFHGNELVGSYILVLYIFYMGVLAFYAVLRAKVEPFFMTQQYVKMWRVSSGLLTTLAFSLISDCS